MNLFDTLNNALTPDVVSKIAKLVDEEPSKTQKALDSINYTLIAGLIKRTTSNMGVNMLYNQIKRANYNGSILDGLEESLDNKAKVENLVKTGDSLLSQLFPAYKSPLTSMIGAYSGIKKASANMLSSLSTVVLIDGLGKRIAEKKMESDDLVNYLVEHHETLFEKAPEDLMEKMIPSLGLQELQTSKFAALHKAPVQKTQKPAVKPVSSLDRPSDEVGSLNARPFPLRAVLIGLGAAAVIAGCVYYYTQYYQGSETAETTAATASSDSLVTKKVAVPAKPDSTKKDSSKIAKPETAAAVQHSSFGEELNTYLADSATPVGKIIEMSGISFAGDSYSLNKDAEKIAVELAGLMKQYPKSQIKLLGYANDGVNISNQSLALKRAFAIKQKLQSEGIATTRIDFGTGGTTVNKIQIKVVAK